MRLFFTYKWIYLSSYFKSAILLILLVILSHDAWAGPNRHLLVLHSYHKGLAWTDAITKGIEAKFRESKVPVDIEYAYMDTKRVSHQAYLELLVELYRVRFKGRSFDAVISSDDNAFKFLLDNHQKLFGETPVVFCGVNSFKEDMLKDKPQFTGVIESFDMLTTINTALDLQPQAQRLISIGDQTVSGKANKMRFMEIVPNLQRPLEITILDNHTMAEIQAYVSALNPMDIVVMWALSVDRNGDFFSFEESARMISAHSSAPIYSFWDSCLGSGIVGGMMTSGVSQGERAAELALRIIQGEPVKNIPVIKTSPNRYMFDYLQLEKFNLKQFRLPANSIIINRPKTFFSEHKQIFWSLVTIFLSMSTIIISLSMAVVVRKRAERALIASKNRYENVFNSASVALFEMDFTSVMERIEAWMSEENIECRAFLDKHPERLIGLISDLHIKAANPAALSLFKAPDESALIEALSKEIIFDRSSVMKEIIICLAEKRSHFVREEAANRLDGQSLHIIISLNFPHDPGDYQKLVVSLFDISDRKASEEALRRSEDRFRTVFSHAASGMALVDLKGVYIKVNSALCQMLGYAEKELLQKTWRDITHQDDISLSLEYLDQVLTGAVAQPIEKRYFHKNGHIVHILLNLAAIFDEEHHPLYFIAQIQDISQIKAAQAALKEREERYRQFFEGDLSGVYLSTPEGKLIMCNEVFAKTLGFGSSEEVIGTYITDYYKDPNQRSRLVSQLIEERRIDQFELEFNRKDGDEVQCLINAVGQFDEQDNLIEIQGYLMDISRMKSLEAQLLHAQKMESIGTMAGGVAHDFNNLLMGIMGYTSLILMDNDNGNASGKRLENIKQLVQSGSDLTRQLLGFAKGGKYEVRTTDLNKLILRSIKMFARTHKDIIVQADLSDDLMLVEADRSQLDQVFYNLYLNAFHAMENGGRIDIQTRNRSLGKTSAAPYGLASGRYVQISVQDDGIGMDDKTQQRIFDPFFTTKERERGTGLGLASVYGIIKNHAGSITVKSKPNQGACFTIFLPSSDKTQVETVPESSTSLIKGSETILLVDDEQSVLDAMGSMLTHLGYKVLAASDGESAIDRFREAHQSIDLVILDMVMPGVGGGDAFESFKQIDPDVRVLLCSGYTANGQAADIIERGCQGFIQKPFTISQLSQKLGQVFQRA